MKTSMKNEKEIMLIHESVLQSWLKDIGTFAVFIIVMAFNYYFFGNNSFTMFLLTVFWFMWVMGKKLSEDRIFYDKKSAIKYIEEL